MGSLKVSRDNLVPLDFEYHSSAEKKMHLVCCSLMYKGKVYEHWLHDKTDVEKLKRNLKRVKEEGKILVCFNAVAEGSAIYSLDLDPLDFKWIDIQAEYKMLLNHWDEFKYGKQYIDGRYKVTTPPSKHKYNMSEEERMKHDFSLPKSNLLACTYKMLGIEVDSEHKNTMRDLILSKDFDLIQRNKYPINAYCSSDIKELLDIWDKIKEAYYRYFELPERGIQGEITMEEVLYRGRTVARSAIMQRIGYPVNEPKLRNLVKNSPIIMREMMENINSQFEWDLFSPTKSDIGYKQNQKVWKEFIAKSEHGASWTKTKLGTISLKLDSFTDKFSYRHDFPEGNFYAQAIRFLKTKQALNGLAPSKDSIKKKDTIFDSLGSDSRVRYYPNSYGGQSARYQPPQKSFIFLKPSWMRGVVEPPKGKAICSIDYKSEEALIGALNSGDTGMLDAYASGDVYLDYAKRAKGVPQDATKKSHKKERDLFKSTYLGISYLMGAKALAKKLTADTGLNYTEGDAKELIAKFYEAYPTYKKYLDNVVYTYSELGFLKLSDGWTMFGNNTNFRSVSNLPIQGEGSCILRKAIELAQDAGLAILFGLHDALYIEYDSHNLSAVDTLRECMRKAFAFYFKDELKDKAYDLIQFDIDIWGPDYDDGTSFTPQGHECKRQNIYIDPRSVGEYEKFKKYMN
jgi:hypothetical protein